jgi:hypothetical protein
VTGIARVLVLAGAAGVIAAAFLPWVTVEGLPLDLDLLQTRISPVGRTVTGDETAAWPGVVGAGAVVGVLALLNLARRLVVLLGLVIALAGAGLVYYVLNVVEIETAGRSAVEQAVAGAVVSSSAGPGPFLLLASGICILAGGLLRSRD